MTRPVIQTELSAGADLVSAIDLVIRPGLWAEVPTGYEYDIDTTSFVRGRSSLAFKHRVIGFEGTVDADYRGEVKVLLKNDGVGDFYIKKGDRIAQLVPVNSYGGHFFQVLDNKREGGFGSTGK